MAFLLLASNCNGGEQHGNHEITHGRSFLRADTIATVYWSLAHQQKQPPEHKLAGICYPYKGIITSTPCLPLTLHACAIWSQNSVLNSPLDIQVTFIVIKARVQSTASSIHGIVDHHSKHIVLRFPWGNVHCRRQRAEVPWEHVHPHLKAPLQDRRNICTLNTRG